MFLLLSVGCLLSKRPARVLAGESGFGAASPERMSTPEHVRQDGWWPTKPAASREAYAGSARCAECHKGIVAEQATSQMAHTLVRGAEAAVVGHEPLAYVTGDFHYVLERAGRDLTMTVSGGGQRRTAVMEWAFGSGEVGQGYLWRDGDQLQESRFNFFASTHGLAETPGRLAGSPLSLDMAYARPLEAFEAKTCFACHTTAMFPGKVADPKAMIAGVSCEACHGPGAAHVQLMQARGKAERDQAGAPPAGPKGEGVEKELAIVNSGRMSPVKAVEMCGACHSTPWDVRLMGASGVQTVRFPAYRLEQSRCWGAAGDDRLKCAGCHDPHGPLERRVEAYDTTCLSCHAVKGAPLQETASSDQLRAASGPAGHPGKACPVATSRCASCHMPKYELPEMHAKFTDHRIRVDRGAGAFPD